MLQPAPHRCKAISKRLALLKRPAGTDVQMYFDICGAQPTQYQLEQGGRRIYDTQVRPKCFENMEHTQASLIPIGVQLQPQANPVGGSRFPRLIAETELQ
jgi:hypothetical protein